MIVSVITAVYNRADTIAMAVESLRSQTHEAIEHVVVDGASSDGTLDVLHALSHPSMKVVSEKDGGIYDALNKGMARATGDVVGLLHSDDYFAHPHVLERVAGAFADPGVQAVYGDLDYVFKDDPTRVVRRWRAGEYTRERLARGWMPPHPTLFVRREVIERLGAFDTRYRIAADYDIVLRWFGRGELNAVYLPEVLVKMRAGGASNRSFAQIVRKSREDYHALRRNDVGGAGALALKNLAKLPQFFKR